MTLKIQLRWTWTLVYPSGNVRSHCRLIMNEWTPTCPSPGSTNGPPLSPKHGLPTSPKEIWNNMWEVQLHDKNVLKIVSPWYTLQQNTLYCVQVPICFTKYFMKLQAWKPTKIIKKIAFAFLNKVRFWAKMFDQSFYEASRMKTQSKSSRKLRLGSQKS